MERIAQLSRRRMGKSYRKRLGMFNYKVKTYGIRKIKKPDQVPLEEKVKLLKRGDTEAFNKLRKLEKESYYPYGSWTKFGNFKFDDSKTILFNVPELQDFKLKPFVSYRTPKVSRELLEELRELNNFYDEQNLERFQDMSEEERRANSLDPENIKY